MLGINKDLKDLAARGKSINVGVVGIGQMGLSLVSHLNVIPGFRLLAVADMDTSKIVDLYRALNLEKGEIFTSENTTISSPLSADLQAFLDNRPAEQIEFDEGLKSAISNNKVIFTPDC